MIYRLFCLETEADLSISQCSFISFFSGAHRHASSDDKQVLGGLPAEKA